MRPTITLLALLGAAIAPAQETQHIDFCEYWPLAIGNRWEYLDTTEALRCVDSQWIDGLNVYRVDDRLHSGTIGYDPFEVRYMVAIVDGALYLEETLEGLQARVRDGLPFFPSEISDGMPAELQPYHIRVGKMADLTDYLPYLIECGVPLDTPAIWLGHETLSASGIIVFAKGYGPIAWEANLLAPSAANRQECDEATAYPRAHSSDIDLDGTINLDELLRAIQIYNTGGYNCAAADEESEDGYLALADDGNHPCLPHAADFAPVDWTISIDELLRVIQFFNAGGVYSCPDEGTEDGYCAGIPG